MMKAKDGDKQIQQMVEFIKQEAHEKAEEITEKTEQEFNIQKLELIEQAKLEIREDFRQRQADVLTKRRIEKSSLVNEARLRVVRERNDIMERIKDAAKEKLGDAAQSERYPDLLRALIIQGLIRLKERKVKIRCREVDIAVVESILQQAAEEYASIMLRDAGIETAVQLIVDSKRSLSAASSGGVMLITQKNRISIDNTLDKRLELAANELKPVLRQQLFQQ